jgi:asparagine synthase (glutamine-hydrolysing)
MKWSIESRVPFLTKELAEFLLTLPENYLISKGGQTKHIFREAMRGIVPDRIIDRRDKVGFQTPEHTWLIEMDAEGLDLLSGIENLSFLDAKLCREEIKRQLYVKDAFTYQAWRIINICRWAKLFDVRI